MCGTIDVLPFGTEIDVRFEFALAVTVTLKEFGEDS